MKSAKPGFAGQSVSAVVGQNKPGMRDRAVWCLASLLDAFEEVILVDWRSSVPLLCEIGEALKATGADTSRLVCYHVPPDYGGRLVHGDPTAMDICEVLARNIGIRRATGDWIVSTNIDIVVERREAWDALPWNDRTFYTVSRHDVEAQTIEDCADPAKPGLAGLLYLREALRVTGGWQHGHSAVCPGDVWSLIDCCGDFQIAHRDVWHNPAVRGFEESMTGRMFTDSNVQKKAHTAGYGLQAILDHPLVWHINHPSRHGARTNDPGQDLMRFTRTANGDDWGRPARVFPKMHVHEPLTAALYMAAQCNASDFQDHVPRMRLLAEGLPDGAVAVELGTRYGISTAGLLEGARRAGKAGRQVTVHSVDKQRLPEVDGLEWAAREAGVAYHYHVRDSRDPLPFDGELDLLFLDTLHTKRQLAEELEAHGDRVKDGGILAFHDIRLFGWVDEGINGINPTSHNSAAAVEAGILSAIFDWLRDVPYRFEVVDWSPLDCGFIALRVWK
jgi:predicted O-methyltransferase YrrM